MNSNPTIDHAMFRERIAAALAGGLSAAEQSAFDAHAATCEPCAAELARARETEEQMMAIMAEAMPVAGLEDRVIQSLRRGRDGMRWMRSFAAPAGFVHPAVRYAATGVAAAVLLGGFGYVATRVVETSPIAAQISGTTALAYNYDSRHWDEDGDRFGLYSSERFAPQAGESTASPDARRGESFGYYARPSEGKAQEAEEEKAGKKVWTPGLPESRVTARTSDLSVVTGDAVVQQREVSGVDGPERGDWTWFKPVTLGDQSKDRPALAGLEAAERVGTVSLSTESVGERADPDKGTGAGGGIRDDVSGRVIAAVPEFKLAESASPAQPNAPAPAPSPAQAPTAVPPADAAPQTAPAAVRKIIRNGMVEFEVERFDPAFAQVVKLVQEAGGYVGTTDSEKLPNGKVKGTIIVRIPPDRLDTLVLQLRGIGDLKSQKLEAQDVSKKYFDLDSALRAARAMEERLLAIIKEGKGQIKDLLAAEKELGNWRTKIEQLTGEIRYFDNLVAMSTLNITLVERDIATAATAVETETIDAGVESEDVEKARAEALKAIEEAQGRVIQSDLKRYDAGQFGATIVAEVPPDRAGPLMDRIRQIGKVARLDVQRKQITPENAAAQQSRATNPPVRVEKRDTRLNLSLYNLANVAPRQTTMTTIAAQNVEQAYQAILERVTEVGGRIITSSVSRDKPEQTSGMISFEVPAAQAEAVANDVTAAGETLKRSTTENPDVQNVTTAKRGFNVSLVSWAAVAPRETIQMQLAAVDVAAAREAILQAASAGGARVLSSQLSESDGENATAKLELDVQRAALPAVEKALAEAGQTIQRQSSRSNDTENTLDSKVRLTLTVAPANQLPPRETTTLSVELRDVEAASTDLQSAAQAAGGRTVELKLSSDRDGRSQSRIVVEVPLEKAQEVIQHARDLGTVRAIDSSKNLQVPAGALSRARVEVTLGNADAIVGPERGLLASIRRGLATSLAGLAWSVQLIVIGLCFVLPWVLILWLVWKWIRRRTQRPAAASA